MYNNGFPVTYPQFQPPQAMTMPTIHADIIQIPTEQDAWNQNVNPGDSRIMILRDESAIFIKSAYTDRQPTMDIYRREAQKALPDPSQFVTKDELAEALKALHAPKEAAE